MVPYALRSPTNLHAHLDTPMYPYHYVPPAIAP